MALISISAPRSRRRTVVFCSVFFPAVVAGLLYVYTRPPQYRAVARLQISPAAVVTQPADTKDTPVLAPAADAFLTEVQALTSRPLLDNALARLKQSGPLPALGPDPAGAAQRMLETAPIAGTQIVELSAQGPDREFVPHLVNAVVAVYRQRIAAAYKWLAAANSGYLKNEVRSLGAQAAAKRQAVDAFRTRYDIVSMEHRENDVLANIEGLSESYTDANERLAKAQAHLQALKASIAAGSAVLRAKDDPTLADLQQRASVLREQWHDLERRFTPAYLAMDADAKSLRARLDNLEHQLAAQHSTGERAALAEAQQDLSAAQTEVAQLQQDVADNQKKAQEFSTHLNQFKTMREDLDHLEAMHRAALDRLAKLEASARERAPHVEVLEAAAAAGDPWRPDYRLNAALAVAGSLGLGLFAAWFADFLAGPPPFPPALLQPAWAPALIPAGNSGTPHLPVAPDVGRLPAPEPLPRELADNEIAALAAAMPDDARLVVAALLTGLSVRELVAWRWDEIDLAAGRMTLGGAAGRIIPLEAPLRRMLGERLHRRANGAPTILCAPGGGSLAIDDVDRMVLFGAYDAGLDRPQEVTAEAVRYTYLSFLLRQGLRAADVGRAAGDIPQTRLLAYMQVHSPAARRPLEEIERLHPALRELTGSGRGGPASR